MLGWTGKGSTMAAGRVTAGIVFAALVLLGSAPAAAVPVNVLGTGSGDGVSASISFVFDESDPTIVIYEDATSGVVYLDGTSLDGEPAPEPIISLEVVTSEGTFHATTEGGAGAFRFDLAAGTGQLAGLTSVLGWALDPPVLWDGPTCSGAGHPAPCDAMLALVNLGNFQLSQSSTDASVSFPVTWTVQVPEPSAAALVLAGAGLGAAARGRRRRSR